MIEDQIIEGDVISVLGIEQFLISFDARLEDAVIKCFAQNLYRLEFDLVLRLIIRFDFACDALLHKIFDILRNEKKVKALLVCNHIKQNLV